VSIKSCFPSSDFSLHRFGVGLQAFGRDFFAWACFSAHRGGGSSSDGLVGVSDDGTDEFVKTFLTEGELIFSHVLEFAILLLGLVFQCLEESFFSGRLIGDDRAVIISSGSADLVDSLFGDSLDHEDWDGHNEHEDAHWGKEQGVAEGAPFALLLSDTESESTDGDEVDSDDVEDDLNTFDKVLKRTLHSVEIKETVDPFGVKGHGDGNTEHAEAK